MDNKRLAFILITISFVFGFFLIYFNLDLSLQSKDLNCTLGQQCQEIDSMLSVTNIGFGFFGFMLALGVYILIFNKSEERLLKRLDEERDRKIGDEKFDLILKVLDDYEGKVIKAIREQDGITQNTLRIRTNMSKAKLSYVLQELEKRNLIKRISKGKTMEVYLRI